MKHSLTVMVMLSVAPLLCPPDATASTPVVVDAGGVGADNSLTMVGGRPALAYRDASVGRIKYVRALDATGGTWGTPVYVSPVVAGSSCSRVTLAVVGGRPAISYLQSSVLAGGDALMFVRASDADGASWQAPVEVFSGDVGAASMAVVAGRPAIAFCDYGADALRFVRAADASGAVWPASTVVDAGGWYIELGLVGARPAVAHVDPEGNGLRFVMAGDDEGGSWQVPVDLASGGTFSSLAAVDLRPALSYVTGGEVRYLLAADSGGASWESPVDLGPGGLKSSLALIAGRPAVAFPGLAGHLSYVRSTDETGSSWPVAVVVDGLRTVADLSLADVGGLPAVAYEDRTSGSLMYVRGESLDFASVQVGPGLVDFGMVRLGSDGSADVEVTNWTSSPVTLTGATIAAPVAREFSVASGMLPRSLEPGASGTITIRFRPRSVALTTATLTIATDGGATSPESVELRGRGTHCRLSRVTVDSGAYLPHIMLTLSSNGQRLAFASDFDLVPGQNQDMGREVFLFQPGAGLEQITSSPDGLNAEPSISPDGGWVVISSDADLVPGGNLDRNLELFLYRVSTGELSQLTETTGVGHLSPTLSDRAEDVVFLSNADSGGNGDGNWEIFRLKRSSGIVSQLTDTFNAGNHDPVISGSGAAIVFQSSHDLVPGSNTDGNREIFLFRPGSGFLQITSTTGAENRNPAIDHEGDRVVFLSSHDLVPGHNSDGSTEVFLWDASAGFTQISDTAPDTPIYSPSIDDSGSRVAFIADADLVSGFNDDLGDEIFLYDIDTGELSQATAIPPNRSIYPAEIGGSRLHIAFCSDADLVGDGTAGAFEVYLLECGLLFDDFVTGDERHWVTSTAE